MDAKFLDPALVLGPCPECGNGKLEAVFDGELTNFLCRTCGCCWHAELEWVQRVDPATCPGCAAREVCLAARRPHGQATPEHERGTTCVGGYDQPEPD